MRDAVEAVDGGGDFENRNRDSRQDSVHDSEPRSDPTFRLATPVEEACEYRDGLAEKIGEEEFDTELRLDERRAELCA